METQVGTFAVKKGLAQMLKGGVIMDVVTPEHAKIAEDAGACAVMALERVPADIRADGGVARMSDPGMIVDIMEAVTIPVMAKARIGHFVEDCLEVCHMLSEHAITPILFSQPWNRSSHHPFREVGSWAEIRGLLDLYSS